jgi:hypothetical protein
MVRMVQDIKEKQERAQVLSEEMSKLPKNINRNIYTHRILDIISSIAKQNKEIDKIVSDIRDIQKTINNNSSAVSRADAVAEELIFSAANAQGSDPATVDTYRRLRTLRSKFESLLQSVSKQGQLEKQNRDLEKKVDQEQSRVSQHNFERIRQDLEQVLKDNNSLVSQIKAYK